MTQAKQGPDGQGLRQSMAWLHTWVGLLPGWVLYVILVFGTAAFFQHEIDGWMRPELSPETQVSPRPQTPRATGGNGMTHLLIALPCLPGFALLLMVPMVPAR